MNPNWPEKFLDAGRRDSDIGRTVDQEICFRGDQKRQTIPVEAR
jgi:hypothetical protein